jgi:hypothetical protein
MRLCKIETTMPDEFLQVAAAAMALPTVASMWEDLVSHLGRALRVDWIFIAELPPAPGVAVNTLAAWHEGKIVSNFRFPVELTAEDDRLVGDVCLCTCDAQEHLPHAWLEQIKAQAFGRVSLRDSFGRARGVLVIAHSQRLENGDRINALLRIFAFKAATELERALEDEYLYRELLEAAQGSWAG